MRRFLASPWFPLAICIVMAAATTSAFSSLHPDGRDVDNEQIVRAFSLIGWGVGPVIGILSLIVISILNLIRRRMRIRGVSILHPIIVLAGVVPWLITAWNLTVQPPYTAFARATIGYVGRPMLWGALIACITALIFSIPLLVSTKKKG